MAKNIIKSKTFWINIISITGIISASLYGIEITPTHVGAILGGINIALRTITKEEICWD